MALPSLCVRAMPLGLQPLPLSRRVRTAIRAQTPFNARTAHGLLHTSLPQRFSSSSARSVYSLRLKTKTIQPRALDDPKTGRQHEDDVSPPPWKWKKADDGSWRAPTASDIEEENATLGATNHDTLIQRLATAQIRNAIANGDMSNLKNKGKPLSNLKESGAGISGSEYLANRVLTKSGAVPAWITLGSSIRVCISNLVATPREEREQDELDTINQDILRFNRACPVIGSHLAKLSLSALPDPRPGSVRPKKLVVEAAPKTVREELAESGLDSNTKLNLLHRWFKG